MGTANTETEAVRWTTADLELLPDNGTRYEIIEGVLWMAKHRRDGALLRLATTLLPGLCCPIDTFFA